MKQSVMGHVRQCSSVQTRGRELAAALSYSGQDQSQHRIAGGVQRASVARAALAEDARSHAGPTLTNATLPLTGCRGHVRLRSPHRGRAGGC